ncbi:hypothetical protein OG306_33315 [Streptomyces sp. NBC_01241]|uniref:hypothetical protein n=1 Tax=Streptomyces sp. NBC_01241 TaxID=2903794 RepID=UPI00352C935E|nr:hypothetical protein OG306_33315 [Streptomyces sp. NBC_01241]
MNTKKKAAKHVGFGIQKDIIGEEAVLLLRISNPRRLNTKILGEVLVKYFRGGYKTLILSKNRGIQEKLNLLEFLGRLQATYQESRLLNFERKLIRDRVVF